MVTHHIILTILEGSEKEILMELSKIKQSLNNNGSIQITNKGKYTKKQYAVAALLGASVAMNAFLLYNQSATTVPQISMADRSSEPLSERLGVCDVISITYL